MGKISDDIFRSKLIRSMLKDGWSHSAASCVCDIAIEESDGNRELAAEVIQQIRGRVSRDFLEKK